MAEIDPERIREFLINTNAPALFVFILADLEKGSVAHQALTEVLFDLDAAEDPEKAPLRNLSDQKVREGVVNCVVCYLEIRAVAERLMLKFIRPPKPWWKFW
jgi:hypothetical protein